MATTAACYMAHILEISENDYYDILRQLRYYGEVIRELLLNIVKKLIRSRLKRFRIY